MHDDRVLIEQRIERILRERLRPAVHGQDVPLVVEVWHAPGEPVAVTEALQAPYRPAPRGRGVGPGLGHELVPRHRLGARGVGRPPGGGRDRPRVRHRPARLLRGRARPPPRRHGRQRAQPLQHLAADRRPRRGRGAGRRLRRGGGQPAHPGRGHAAGRRAHGRPGAALPRAPRSRWPCSTSRCGSSCRTSRCSPSSWTSSPSSDPRRWNILRALQRAFDALDLRDVPGTAAAVRAALAPALAAPPRPAPTG